MKGRRSIDRFVLALSPATPFLISSGNRLRRMDYVIAHQPRTGAPLIRVIDYERFLGDPKVPAEKKVEVIEKRAGFNLDRYFRYTLACEFRRVEDGLELIECRRDPAGNPRVPASSARGLIRTAVLFAALKAQPERLRRGVERAGWRAERAAAALEAEAFGDDPGRSPLRAVRLAEPAPGHVDDVKAYEIGLLSLRRDGFRMKYSFHAECWNPAAGAAMEIPISVDHSQLARGDAPAVAEALSTRGGLLAALRGLSAALVEAERRFYAAVAPRDLLPLWEEVVRRAAGKALLPFGHGTGWHTKTAGLLLDRDALTRRLKPLLSPERRYEERAGQILHPKTRRWVLHAGRPAHPLGWTLWE